MLQNWFKIKWAILLLLINFSAFSQTISPNTIALVETFRRQQMLNGGDTLNFSLMSLPLLPSLEGNTYFNNKLSSTLYNAAGLDFRLLYPESLLEWNSKFPYFSNNGSMVPARGLQHVLTGGVAIRSNWLSIQLRPEVRFSENLEYQGFPDSQDNDNWRVRYRWWNRNDSPERYGESTIFDVLPGQSHALITFRKMGLGASTENLWWGPGRRNSLLMSNNARGFSHLTFRSLAPNNIGIGQLEWQLIAGRLEGSGFDAPQPSDPVRPVFDSFRPFEDDWRYLNAFNIIYQPKWVKGLYLGMSRAVQQYSGDVSDNGDYLPAFINFFRGSDDPDRTESEIDQLLSFSFRWLLYDARTEIYFEYGRNDASLNVRDFLMSPRHSRAYIFGISKVFDIPWEKWSLQISYEHTHMEQSTNFIIRNAGSWYLHSGVRHGYTNRGEVLGSGIGPGSNLDYFEFALFDGITKLAFEFERLAHNQDYFYQAFEDTRDWRRFWIDYTFGLAGTWQFDRWLLSGSLKFTRAMNYQWELFDNPNNRPYFNDGTDLSNLHFSLRTVFLLNK